MADLDITGVGFVQTSTIQVLQLGETVDAFGVVYRDPATQKYFNAQAVAGKDNPSHMVLGVGNPDEWVAAVMLNRKQTLTIKGVTMSVGLRYVLSANAGKIAPRSDLITGNLLTELWVASTTGEALVDVFQTGVAIP